MAWLILIISYLIGSIPTAYLVGRWLKDKDIRQLGDTNMGAANVYHEVGPRAGFFVGLMDSAKGIIAILIAEAINLSEIWILMAGIAAVAGHNWPIFLGFRGGRGVSTTIGVLLVTVTLPILIMAGPCIITLLLTKNVSKAMAVLFVPLSGLGWWLGLPWLLIGYSILIPIIVGLTHLLRSSQLEHLHP